MANDRRAAIKKLKSLYLSPKIDINDFRAKINETFSSVFLPNNVEREEKKYKNIKCDVLFPEMYASNRVLFYVHGGSFVAGSREAYRPFAAALANATASKTYLPEFRLAPAHPFPAALEDVQEVFRDVYAETQNSLALNADSVGGSKEPEIIIAADTSGASIALALIFGLSSEIRSSIRQIILMSPWLDFSEENEIYKNKKVSDEVFTADSIRLASEHYTYQENWENPKVSPLKAGRDLLEHFPPVFIQLGEKEIFNDSAFVFKEMLKSVACKCEIDIWKNMMPMFQLADDELSEAHLAVEKIGKLITAKDYSDESVREIQLKLERS